MWSNHANKKHLHRTTPNESKLEMSWWYKAQSLILKNYQINYSRPGLLLIFNNKTFKNSKLDRAGSERDVENVRKTFEKFNFEIHLHLDKSAEEMLHLVKHYAQRDFTNDSCIILFIMSHGGEHGTILASDDIQVNLNDFIQPFKNADTLKDKPRLFFVQACRGQLAMKSIADEIVNGRHVLETKSLNDFIEKEAIQDDFLICYSTVEGYFSLR